VPTETTREDPFIKLFLSAYENGSWADADVTKPDAIDRTNPAVDQVATRKSDGKILAIEHTIIEPFLQEKADFASFSKADFPGIEGDSSLPVPGLWISVFVPIGTLEGQPIAARNAIVQSIHSWIKLNRLRLAVGTEEHLCPTSVAPGSVPASVKLTVRVDPLSHGPSAPQGILHIRRQQVDNNLGDVIEKALKKKLPKLVNTPANKRILLLERQHMILSPKTMLGEIESRRDSFPSLASVDEIWFLETIFYETPFGGTYLRFELYHNVDIIRSYDFYDGRLLMKFEDGVAEVLYYAS